MTRINSETPAYKHRTEASVTAQIGDGGTDSYELIDGSKSSDSIPTHDIRYAEFPIGTFILAGLVMAGLVFLMTDRGNRFAGICSAFLGGGSEMDKMRLASVLGGGVPKGFTSQVSLLSKSIERSLHSMGFGWGKNLHLLIPSGEKESKFILKLRQSPGLKRALGKIRYRGNGWGRDSRGVVFAIDCNRLQRSDQVANAAFKMLEPVAGRRKVVFFSLVDVDKAFFCNTERGTWVLNPSGLRNAKALFLKMKGARPLNHYERARCQQVADDLEWLARRLGRGGLGGIS